MRGPTRIAFRGGNAEAIDLGHEPPLTIGEETEEAPIRRSVSIRWLAGTILTGFTSIFLMGGALMAALDNPNQFAETPDGIASEGGDVATAAIKFGAKGDRIRPLEEEVSSRQLLQVSTVTKQGERDFIKLRPFAKVTATLATRKSEISSEIPAYDALRIFADTSAPEAPAPGEGGVAAAADDQIYGADVDGEVSVKISDFPAGTTEIATQVGFPMPEVEEIVRASANFPVDPNQVASALPFADPSASGDEAGLEEEGPFSGFGVRIIPENVSNIAKNDGDAPEELAVEEKVIAIAKGQSFRTLLQENDISGDDADEIVAALAELVDLNKMHVGQKLRVSFAPGDLESDKPAPIRVSIYDDGAHQATVARNDDNSFVRADEPLANAGDTEMAAAGPADDSAAMPRVYDAVYQTALEQQVPKPLIDQLVRVFAFDVDLQGRITPGDSLEVFHSLADETDKDASEPEVLFAALTLNGLTKRFYRFRTLDDSLVDYYDEEGRSAKKFLMRKPITAGILRSTFGMRRHPILGYRRMHTGIDYAAPRMTPILAAGNGVVEKASKTSGYGNFTLIKHTNGYETGYGHQTSFAKGIVPGARVRQGQIIGYVGSTGLSTGPHLHFEIRVNKSPVDPLRIRLPRGRVLDGQFLAAFEAERQRIDTLLGNEVPSTKVAAVTD